MKTKFIFALIILIAALIYFLSINNELGNTGDNASYMIFATSILNEGKLLFYNRPGNIPSGFNIFVYPLILSPIVYFFNFENIFLLKFISVISTIMILCFFYYTFSKYLNKKICILSLILLAFNPVIISYSHQIMSESLYLLFICIFFYIIIQKKLSLKNTILLTLLSIAVYFTRNVGICLFITLILYLLYLKEYKKTAVALIIYILFTGFISLYFKADDFTGGNLYFSILKMRSQYTPDAGTRTLIDIFKTSIYNLIIYILKILPDTFFYPFFFEVKKFSLLFWFKSLSGIVLFLFFIYGFLKNNNKKLISIKIFVIINIIILLIWQISSNRYLHSLIPFISIFIIWGILNLIPFKSIQKIILSIIIISNIISAAYIIYNERNYIKKNEWREYFDALYYLKENIQTDKTVFSRKPTLTYVISGIKSVEYPFTTDIDNYTQNINQNNVKYILKDNLTISGINSSDLYLENYINKSKYNFNIISKTGNTIIYGINN